MIILNTSKEVLDLLQQKDKEVLYRIAKDTRQGLANYVWEHLYGYDPIYYERTYEFYNSVVNANIEVLGATAARRIGFRISINTDYMKPYPPKKKGRWGQHTDVYGKDMVENIPSWLMDGTSGGLFPRGDIDFVGYIRGELKANGIKNYSISKLRGKDTGFIINVK